MKISKFEIQSTKEYQNSNVRMAKTFGILNFCHLNLFRISHVLFLLFSCVLVYFVAGCEPSDGKKPSLTKQIHLLEQEKTQLTHQIDQLELDNKQLQKQILILSSLPEDAKSENVYDLQRIKITRYTNLYDKDKDGKKEKLIVYIQPMDTDGDIIKASGAVDVQLWDLNRAVGQALLGQWRVEPEELKKLWFATLLTINYRLTFDVADKIEKFEDPLIVKVIFTDYLSGKVFKEQKVIKPSKSP